MLNVARVVFFAYAVLLIAGGIAGYVEKTSVISLVAGVVTGLIALAAGIYLTINPTVGLVLGILAAVLAGGGMAPRYAKSKSVWPAGTVLAASVVALVVGVAAFTAPRGGTASPNPPAANR
ncbi:MAG: TMEM14 family protein [Cytophagales bacterium]|nr:TMEM14 family protein [Armatimonadota bacterium]